MIHNPDSDSPREHLIPVDLTQPLVLEIHNPSGDVAVRAIERPDVRIDADVLHLSDSSDDEASISVDARGNRIAIRSHPHAGVGWAGFAGGIDLESVVGQVAKAFRAGASFASARPGTARVRSGDHGGTDMAVEIPRTISCRLEVHSASGGGVRQLEYSPGLVPAVPHRAQVLHLHLVQTLRRGERLHGRVRRREGCPIPLAEAVEQPDTHGKR